MRHTNMIIRNVTLLVCIFLFSQRLALAQNSVLLFINLNYSTQEYAQALKIAARKNQTLEMVPPVHVMNSMNNLQQLRRKVSRAMDSFQPGLGEIRRNNYLASDENISQGMKAYLGTDLEEYRRLRQQHEKIEQEHYPSIVHQIIEKVSDIKSRGLLIDRIVVSSHSEGASLFGETSLALHYSDFSTILEAAPAFFLEPKQIIILSCYSGTKMFLHQYRNYFKNASLIAGFHSRSPSRYTQAAIDIFDHLASVGDELDGTSYFQGELNEAQKRIITEAFFRRPIFKSTHASVDYRGNFISSAPPSASCEEQWLVFNAWSTQLRALYFSASDESAVPLFEPPIDSPNSELLKFYTHVQQLCPVSDAKGGEFIDMTDSERIAAEANRREWVDMGVRLRFWRHVQSNFSLYYKKDLAELRKTIKSMGFKSTLPSLDGSTGRIEFSKFYDDIVKETKQIAEKIDQYNNTKFPTIVATQKEIEDIEKQYQRAADLFDRYSQFTRQFKIIEDLIQLNKNIPINWVEAGAVAATKN